MPGTSEWLKLERDATIPFDFSANPIIKGGTVLEPTTGATIKRLTDVTRDCPGSAALYNGYSRFPAENVTGEYVLAFACDSHSCLVIDRATGNRVASLTYDDNTNHTIGAYNEIRWHYTPEHPYRVYFVRGLQFWMIDDVRNQANTRERIKDFAEEDPLTHLPLIDWDNTPDNDRKIYMDQEGNSSLDSDHWAWMAVYYDGSNYRVRAFVHYQISTKTLDLMYPNDMSRFSNSPSGEQDFLTYRHRPNMVEMAPDGSGVVIHHERAFVLECSDDKYNRVEYISSNFEAPYLWPRDFKPGTFQPFRIAAGASHSGWSSVNGAWYFINQDDRRDKWCAVPISGEHRGYGNEGIMNVTQAALGAGVIDFYTHTPAPGPQPEYPGMHFGVCTGQADGWTFVSTYTGRTAAQYGLGNALAMIQIKPEVEAIKWHIAPSCNQYPQDNPDKQDYNEAPASINLAGTRVHTSGDWNGTTAIVPNEDKKMCQVREEFVIRYVDIYEIDLPDGWAAHNWT